MTEEDYEYIAEVSDRRNELRRRGFIDTDPVIPEIRKTVYSNECDTALTYTGSLSEHYGNKRSYLFGDKMVTFTENDRSHMVPRWFAERMAKESGWEIHNGPAKVPLAPLPAPEEPGRIRTEEELERYLTDEEWLTKNNVTDADCGYIRELFLLSQSKKVRGKWKEFDERMSRYQYDPTSDVVEAIDE